MTRTCLGFVVATVVAGCATSPREESLPASAPLAALEDVDGHAVDIDADLARGETVALVVWQTWCPSCEREAPAIASAHAQHGDAIRFIGVVPGKDADVDPAQVAARRAAWGYTFPQVRDRDLSLCRALDVDGTPAIVVLGPGRAIRFRGHRAPADWSALRGPAIQTDDASVAAVGSCETGVCPLPTTPAR